MPVDCEGSLEANLRSLDTTSQRSIQHTVIGEMLAGSDDGRRSLALADLFAGRQLLLPCICHTIPHFAKEALKNL
eukprot:622418-Amphidinium_carterae.1